MTQSLKESYRTSFIEYVNDDLNSNFDGLSDVERGRAMARFYVTNVLGVLYPQIVPDDEEGIETSLVDGSNDMGVDFIYRSDSRVLIIQSKYRKKKGKNEDSGEFHRFASVIERLQQAYRSGAKIKEDLLDVVADIDWLQDSFDLRFITLGKETQEIREAEALGYKEVESLPNIQDRASLRFLDESDLNQEIRSAVGKEDYVHEIVKLNLKKHEGEPAWITYENAKGRRCYIAKISGGQVYELVKRYKDRLFSLNIRNYLGDIATNKNIVSTATNDPECFFFFNNGISAVATNIEEDRELGILKCERLSIINGAQTVNSIYRAMKRDPANSASNADILIRVSEINYTSDVSDGGFLDCVTQYNNTQNSIKLSDFRSNDPIQKELHRRFDKLVIGAKRCHYMNKRQKAKSGRIPIRLEDFTKLLHSFQYGPVDYFGGNNYLYDTSGKGGYVKVFGEDGVLWDAIDDRRFGIMSGIWILCSEFQKQLKEEKEIQIDAEAKRGEESPGSQLIVKDVLRSKFMVMFVLGEILRYRYEDEGPSNLDEALVKLSKHPSKVLDGDQFEKFLSSYTKFACELLIKAFKIARMDSKFATRDWFRNPRYLQDLKDEIALSRSTISIYGLMK